MCGDTFNLLGCLLTGDQNATQVVTAIYFLIMDCVILSQFIYYGMKKQRRLKQEAAAQQTGGGPDDHSTSTTTTRDHSTMAVHRHSVTGYAHTHAHHPVMDMRTLVAAAAASSVAVLQTAAYTASTASLAATAPSTSYGNTVAQLRLGEMQAMQGAQLPICGESTRPEWTWYVGMFLG